jgi:hypothetical protein
MRARAQIQLVKSYQQADLSRLALSVLLGTLQSFVPASPSDIGASFMQNLYTDLRFVTENTKSFSAFYSVAIALSPLGQLDLEWWDKVLTQGFEVPCQTPNFSMLEVAWVDDS